MLLGLCAATGCPSGDAGVGAPTSATAGMMGSTGEAMETSTGFDTIADGTGGGTTAAPIVEVVCGDLPASAVGAEYAHAFAVDPDEGSWNWTVDGLPAGVTVSPLSGTLSGTPTEEGTFELTVLVDGSMGMGEATCTLEVGPALTADLSVLARPCVGPADALNDVLVGGDGSPITCESVAGSGNGNGSTPDAVTVNAESCAIEGSPTEDEYGTWVWLTAVEQAGARVLVPFCMTQDTPAPDTFDIAMQLGDDTEALLEPLTSTFAVGETVAFGGEGDPAFTVIGGCGPSSCYYGFNYAVGSSPFGGECGQDNCFGLGPTSIVNDADDNPIGFTHTMFAYGPEVPESFAGRPFVLPWNLTYCIGSSDGDCDDVLANPGGRVHVSLLMLPE
jgi:hypothetical protein